MKEKPEKRETHHDAILSNLIGNPELARDLDLDVKIGIVNTLGEALAGAENVGKAVTVFELLKPEIIKAAELVTNLQESLSEKLMVHAKKEWLETLSKAEQK